MARFCGTFCEGVVSEEETKTAGGIDAGSPGVMDENAAGLAELGTRQYKLVKSDDPDALVFQSVKDGQPMNDQNILKRHLQPAARKLGLPFVNWRCLRTSHATWLVQAGADPKSVQGQMRHSRISTTMDIYAQIVPASQRQAIAKLSESAKDARSITVQ